MPSPSGVGKMKVYRGILFASIVLTIALFSAKNGLGFENVLRLSDGTIISSGQMIEDLKGSKHFCWRNPRQS